MYGISLNAEDNEMEEEAMPLGSSALINGHTQSEALDAPFYVYFSIQKNSFSLRVHGRHGARSQEDHFPWTLCKFADGGGKCAHLIGAGLKDIIFSLISLAGPKVE